MIIKSTDLLQDKFILHKNNDMLETSSAAINLTCNNHFSLPLTQGTLHSLPIDSSII